MSGYGIPNFLLHRAQLTPSRTAIFIDEQVGITFGQLDQEVRKWVTYFQSKNIKRNMHIGICMPNSLLLIQIIFALQYLGAVTVFLNTRLTEKEKIMQLKDADTYVLLVSEWTDAIQDKSIAVHILSLADADDYSKATDLIVDVFEQTEVATIMFTSGTTGRAKGVMQTYGNHFYSAINAVLNMGLEMGDRWLLQLPIYHVSGYSTLIKSMVYGMPMILPQKKDLASILQTIQAEKATVISMVAKNLQDIFSLGEAERLSDLRAILLGGGPVDKQLLHQCEQYKLPIHLSYGMTETASQMATLGGRDVYRKIGSVGKPLYLNQIQIDGVDRAGLVGEILIKGPTVMKGYYHLPEETEKRMTKDGYFRTGDLGFQDEEGFLYIVDRRSDLIISGGENIYPAEIEIKMMELGIFREVAVVGQKDEIWGNVPVAFYVMQDGKSITSEEILAYLTEHLAKYKLPKRFYCIEKLPRNALGKVQKTVLMQRIKE